MSFNTIIDWNGCRAEQQQQLLMRPAISASESISKTVAEILNNVKDNGDAALREYGAMFDKTEVTALKVSEEEIAAAGARLSDELKQAMAVAVRNIETFHNAQRNGVFVGVQALGGGQYLNGGSEGGEPVAGQLLHGHAFLKVRQPDHRGPRYRPGRGNIQPVRP